MPVVDSTLFTRRANITTAVAALVAKKRGLSPQDIDLIGRYEEELFGIEQRIGTTADERHTRAFTAWLRHGAYDVTPEQRWAFEEAGIRGSHLHYRDGQVVSMRPEYRATVGLDGTPSGGAYPGSSAGLFVPLGFIKQIVSAAKYTAPWFDIADLHVTATGAPLVQTADNDIAVAAVAIGEAAADSTSDVNLVAKVLETYRYTSLIVKVSNETLEDTGIDIDAYLAKRFAARMMRGLDPKYAKGVGTTEPLGVLTGLTASLTAVGTATNDGSTPAGNTIGSDDIANLELALDPAYRPGARFMMHSNTLNALRRVKDKQGRPVFPGLQEGSAPTLLNYPVTLANGMDQLQTAASSPTVTRVPIAFGDFNYYKIRLVAPTMIRLSTLFAANYQTGFLLNWRTDAALVDGASTNRAVVTLQTVY